MLWIHTEAQHVSAVSVSPSSTAQRYSHSPFISKGCNLSSDTMGTGTPVLVVSSVLPGVYLSLSRSLALPRLPRSHSSLCLSLSQPPFSPYRSSTLILSSLSLSLSLSTDSHTVVWC